MKFCYDYVSGVSLFHKPFHDFFFTEFIGQNLWKNDKKYYKSVQNYCE